MAIEAEAPEAFGYERIRFNLAESSVRDRTFGELGVDLSGLVLCYADHRGNPELRARIAARAGGGLGADDVLVTAGASAALFILAMTLLEAGDHLVVVQPNYATNIATPRGLSCDVDLLRLRLEAGFALDLDELAGRLRPTTRLVSLTTPHNPTGVCLSGAELSAALELAEASGARLLVDETYRDMAFAPPSPVAATLSPRAVSVSSLSKSFGLPGARLGWILCRDRELMEALLATKEQIGICGSVADEAIALAALEDAEAWLAASGRRLAEGLGQVRAWIAGEPLLEWVEPAGGCVVFPRIRAGAGVDVAGFYRRLKDEHGAFVGPGHWFDEDDRHFRIGYGWPTPEELAGGLAAISAALRSTRR